MAHRGGGGHSGGSHHSHHSSSHHSGSGSRSTYSRPRVSRTHYPGARRFVYYRHRRPYVVYSDTDITRNKFIQNPLFILIYIPFIFAIFTMFTNVYSKPSKLYTNYDTTITIEDKANVMGDTTRLKKDLKEFQDKTGITPRIQTVNYKKWDSTYRNVGEYGLDEYYRVCENERYWFIVYSVNSSGSEWQWEDIMGDSIDDIINDEIGDDFRRVLQENLNKGKSLEDSLSLAFKKIYPDLMKGHFDPEILFMAIIMGGFICFHAYFMMGINPNARYYKNAVVLDDNSAPVKCSYCNCDYYINPMSSSCPFCGASSVGASPAVSRMGSGMQTGSVAANVMSGVAAGVAMAVAQNMQNQTQNTYGTDQNAYGTSQSSYGTNQNSYGTSQNIYGADQNAYGTSQSSYGTDQNAYGTSQNTYGTSQNTYGTNQNAYDYDSILGGNAMQSPVTPVQPAAPSMVTGNSTSYLPTDNPYVTYNNIGSNPGSIGVAPVTPTVSTTPGVPSRPSGNSTSYLPTDNPYVTYNNQNNN